MEEKIKSIGNTSLPLPTSPQQCKKTGKVEKSLAVSVITETRSVLLEEAVQTREPDPQLAFEDDWGFSPEAPSSPPSPL